MKIMPTRAQMGCASG